MNYSEKERAFIRAKSRVDKLRAFYTHLTVYIVVNIFISTFKIVRNLRYGGSFEEALLDFSTSASWLLWGIGLGIHAFAVFGLPRILGDNWEEDKIKQFMDEEKNNNLN